MPTAPNPNSPFMDTRLQSTFGLRTPGQPSVAGKPTPQAPPNVSFPAPPAVATAPPGRPPDPSAPAPIGGAPAAGPTPTAAAGGPTATPPAQPTATPPTPGASAPTNPAAAAMPPMTVPRDQIPRAAIDDRQAHQLTPEGQAQYRQQTVALRNKMGPIPSVFRHADLPPMPAEIGKWNINVFTGEFTKG